MFSYGIVCTILQISRSRGLGREGEGAPTLTNPTESALNLFIRTSRRQGLKLTSHFPSQSLTVGQDLGFNGTSAPLSRPLCPCCPMKMSGMLGKRLVPDGCLWQGTWELAAEERNQPLAEGQKDTSIAPLVNQTFTSQWKMSRGIKHTSQQAMRQIHTQTHFFFNQSFYSSYYNYSQTLKIHVLLQEKEGGGDVIGDCDNRNGEQNILRQQQKQ